MKFKKSFVFLFIFSFILFFSSNTFAATSDPKLVTTLNKALTNIKSWIVKISTPAAAVSVCTGALIRKFSFGDEERIATGKKLIKNALFSYVFILSIDLILKTIDSLI